MNLERLFSISIPERLSIALHVCRYTLYRVCFVRWIGFGTAVRIIAVIKFVRVDELILPFIFIISFNELLGKVALQSLVISGVTATVSTSLIRASNSWSVITDRIVRHNILIMDTHLALVSSTRKHLSKFIDTILVTEGLLGKGDATTVTSLVADRVSGALVELVVVLHQLTILGSLVTVACPTEVRVGDRFEAAVGSYRGVHRVAARLVCIESLHLCQVIFACFILLFSPRPVRLARLYIVDHVFFSSTTSAIMI